MSDKKHSEQTEKADEAAKAKAPGKNKWKKFADKSESAEQAEQKTAKEQAEQQDLAAQVETEELPEVEFPSREKLEDQLTAMEKKVFEYKNNMMSAYAELDNLRKRSERDVSNAHKFGTERLITKLLPVIDSMLRGLEGGEPKDANLKAMWAGMNLTLELLEKMLVDAGLVAIVPEIGEEFNPDVHEAMSMQADPKAKPNTIMQVLQKGYRLNGRVIRAAMVMVAE